MPSANKSLEKKNIFHRVENVIKQLVHTSAVRLSRYKARGKFGEHEKCVGVARGVASNNSYASYASRRRLERLLRIFRALQTSLVLHITMNACWRMNQLLILPRELIYLKVLSSEFMKHYEVARNKMLDENPKKTMVDFFLAR